MILTASSLNLKVTCNPNYFTTLFIHRISHRIIGSNVAAERSGTARTTPKLVWLMCQQFQTPSTDFAGARPRWFCGRYDSISATENDWSKLQQTDCSLFLWGSNILQQKRLELHYVLCIVPNSKMVKSSQLICCCNWCKPVARLQIRVK